MGVWALPTSAQDFTFGCTSGIICQPYTGQMLSPTQNELSISRNHVSFPNLEEC